MGSNPSRSVVMDIHIPTTERGKDPKDLYKTPINSVENKDGFKDYRQEQVKEKDLVALLLQMREELRQSKQKIAETEEKAATLQEQLAEREDEIIALQTQVEVQEAKVIEQQQTPGMERTVKAKDQYIQRLEAEMQQLKQESTEVNERYARKLHKVRAMSSKSRQDSSLRMFELKDANVKLKEENTKLKERLERTSVSSASSSRDGDRKEEDLNTESIIDDTRTKLILELSQQVAELDQENSRLKLELKHSRKIADKVGKARSSSGSIKSESFCLRPALPEGSSSYIKSS